MSVAVIPARGGSKRIPRKNVREFCGKPMIRWSIEAALASGCFSHVVVSTDDDEVATEAERAGAEVPFRRPPALSDDHTATLPVIAHALDWLADQGIAPEYACCIYATAPFIEPRDLLAARERLKTTRANYVFTATHYDFPPARALQQDPDGHAVPVFPEYIGHRSQDLPEMFHDAGQFYWGTVAAFRRQEPIFGSGSFAYLLPRTRVQDIDTREDWEHAEILFRLSKEISK